MIEIELIAVSCLWIGVLRRVSFPIHSFKTNILSVKNGFSFNKKVKKIYSCYHKYTLITSIHSKWNLQRRKSWNNWHCFSDIKFVCKTESGSLLAHLTNQSIIIHYSSQHTYSTVSLWICCKELTWILLYIRSITAVCQYYKLNLSIFEEFFQSFSVHLNYEASTEYNSNNVLYTGIFKKTPPPIRKNNP